MTPAEIRTRIACIAERFRDEENRIEGAIEHEIDRRQIELLNVALEHAQACAAILENISMPESEAAVLVRSLVHSNRLALERSISR